MGTETSDNVFILSIEEAERYFDSDEARKCVPTEYAIAQGARCDDNHGISCWWLLPPSDSIYYYSAASVNDEGSFSFWGYYQSYDNYCVRPALWVDLASLE